MDKMDDIWILDGCNPLSFRQMRVGDRIIMPGFQLPTAEDLMAEFPGADVEFVTGREPLIAIVHPREKVGCKSFCFF